MSKTIETFEDIFRDAYANGGGTYWVSVQRNREFVGKSAIGSGFYVATEGNEWCISGQSFSAATVASFVSQNFKRLTDNGNYFLGIWRADSGRWYLDVSEHVRDEEQAIVLGQSRKQISVWDIRRNMAIATSNIPESVSAALAY